MQIKDSTLFKQLCYVNGNWIDAANKAVITVDNPANGETIGTVPSLGKNEVGLAIDCAHAALDDWRSLPPAQRGKYLMKWHELIAANVDDLAMILTTEQGKPLAEARAEIEQGNSYMPWYAAEASRAYGDVIPPPRPGVRTITIRQGIGVAAAITPWNFPFSMIPRKAAPALAAGCTIIIKPASATPYSALALAELAARAGLPPGTVNVVTGNSGVVGGEITANPKVRKLTFTGSTAVGKTLVAQCAATMKKVSMELGGNAPFIVFPDADLDLAVTGAVKAKFRNTGQTCVCADRFLVHTDIHDEFVRRFAERAKTLKLGDGTHAGVDQGPLIDKAALQNMERLVQDAVDKGANVVTGGKKAAIGKLFFEPTVLTNVTENMAAWHEEVFGPIAAIMPFTSEAEVIVKANDTAYGLASYFFSRDASRIVRVSEALAFGMVGVNETALTAAEIPFGGVKESGLGREGGHEGLDDYLETKYIALAVF